MANFAQLLCSTWEDEPGFAEIESADARLLFLWSFTNGQATICGLYGVSLRRMTQAFVRPTADRAEKDAAIDRVEAALAVLGEVGAEKKPLVVYDYDNEVLWVVNRARHANRGVKTNAAMRNEYERCPTSPLKDEFAARYGDELDLRTKETK